VTKVMITKYDEGPFVIKGEFELLDESGVAFKTGNSVALCRCSRSRSQPFCDSTHKTFGFKDASPAR